MKLEIDRPFAEAMMGAFPRLSSWADQMHLGRRIEVAAEHLSGEELSLLAQLCAGGGAAMRTQAAYVSAIRNALADGAQRFGPEDDLERLLPALALYLARDAVRGWVFSANVAGKLLAYVVYRLDYVPSSSDETGKVLVDLRADARGGIVTVGLRFSAADIASKTVAEILAVKGFLKETPELVAAYDRSAERYLDWRARYGHQFTARGIGFYAEDPASPRRDTDWSRKDVVVLSTGGGCARVVNDEGILPARSVAVEATGDILGPYLRKAAKSDRYNAEDEVEKSRESIPSGLFTRCPTHGYVFVFHLELHHYLWVHVDDIEPYEYDPELKNKLVLPPEQTDLIDILTAEMDVLMDDIVAGKSGGTTVLCAGPPGVGKTLTAEVYSEIIRRPLYRVHSGQLGLNVAAMEIALKDALTRAQRWGAVMLIDEADVYIKRRDDDMAANAVVGVFLRILEYFNGLLFLTTNRVEDIDEAIVSRCIALIKYQPPDTGGRRRIWHVMSQQFGLGLAPSLVERLVDVFPAATGRDIKGLAKLVAKYCRHRKDAAPTLEVFERCAIFRAMDIAGPPGGPAERVRGGPGRTPQRPRARGLPPWMNGRFRSLREKRFERSATHSTWSTPTSWTLTAPGTWSRSPYEAPTSASSTRSGLPVRSGSRPTPAAGTSRGTPRPASGSTTRTAATNCSRPSRSSSGRRRRSSSSSRVGP